MKRLGILALGAALAGSVEAGKMDVPMADDQSKTSSLVEPSSSVENSDDRGDAEWESALEEPAAVDGFPVVTHSQVRSEVEEVAQTQVSAFLDETFGNDKGVNCEERLYTAVPINNGAPWPDYDDGETYAVRSTRLDSGILCSTDDGAPYCMNFFGEYTNGENTNVFVVFGICHDGDGDSGKGKSGDPSGVMVGPKVDLSGVWRGPSVD